jgi:hypothetical protein
MLCKNISYWPQSVTVRVTLEVLSIYIAVQIIAPVGRRRE